MAMIEFQKEARKAKFVDEVRAIWQNQSILPRRSVKRRLDALQEVPRALLRQEESTLPYSRQLHRRIRRAADKHLLWRFR